MQRVAFQLRIREGLEAAYDEVHRHVWPELTEQLQSFGVREFSISRRIQQFFLFIPMPTFNSLLLKLSESQGNSRWLAMMAPLLEPVSGIRGGDIRDNGRGILYARRAVGRYSSGSRGF
jgi:L-rhamnose mutarotase